MEEEESNSRDGFLGECVAESVHELMDLGPVVADALRVLVTSDDSDAEVALGGGVPLLVWARHRMIVRE